MENKDLIRLLQTGAQGSARRTWSCPDEAQLAAYADRQLPEQVKERVETHLADCSFCLDQVAFLLRMQGAELPSEVPEALLARARDLIGTEAAIPLRSAYRWGAVAAAMASLALAATLWLQHPGSEVVPSQPSVVAPVESPSPQPRATAVPSVTPRPVRNGQKEVPLPALLFPREGSVVAREDVEFRWKEIRRSLFYEIRVVTAEGDLIWKGQAKVTNARLPADIRLAAGQKYFVWVRAYLPEGKTVQSKALAFRAAGNS